MSKTTTTSVPEEYVKAETFHASDLLHQEDWLAIWIGFSIILLASISVLTGTFDFSAAKFPTWGNGTSFASIWTNKLILRLITTTLVLGVFFTVGSRLKGTSFKQYIPAYFGIFFLAIVVRLVSAEFTLNRYLEWAFFALVAGLIVANTIGLPNWLKPAVQTEFYIKTGLVIMGFSVLFIFFVQEH